MNELLGKYFTPKKCKTYDWDDQLHRLNVRRHAPSFRANGDLLFLRHESGLIKGMPNHLYHQERSCVSSSGLKMFAANPYKFKRLYCDEFGPELEPERDCLTLGSAVHAILFEPDLLDDAIVELKSPDERPFSRRIKLHKEYERALRRRHADKLVMEPDEIRLAFEIAESAQKNPLAMRIMSSPSLKELSLFCREPDSGVRIKSRIDFFCEWEERPTVVDCKTTAAGCSPTDFATTVARYGYDVSAALYCLCFEQVTGVFPRFMWLAIEKDNHGDHQCVLHELDEASMDFAIDETRRLLHDLATCKFDEFKSPYVDRVNVISLPGWRLKEANNRD